MSKIFSKGKNFSEFRPKKVKSPNIVSQTDPTPTIDYLPDGEYEGMRYGYTFELANGDKYKTEYGVRNKRTQAKIRTYIKSGNSLTCKDVKKFSGMAEVGAVLQGQSYGRKPNPNEDITRIKLDTDGFHIPDQIKKEFKVKDKKFSIGGNRDEYKGGIKTPIIGISKDNSIIRRSGKSTDSSNPVSSGLDQKNAMGNVVLDWNQSKPFHLGVEPWITAPLLNDVEDGIYLGNVKGSKFDTGEKIITMMVNIDTDYPESVVALVKNQKIYIFKQSNLTKSVGSKIFSQKIFSEITTDWEFREYAHKLMQEAHKDNYSKEKTDKVCDDLLAELKDQNYGELIGRLKSGLGNKSYSESDDTMYTFEYKLTEPAYRMEAVIGTVVMSVAFAHLFHLCADSYASHVALQEYYNRMPYAIDKLAEAYLETTKVANFQVCVMPQSQCPVEYFERLREFITKYQSEKLQTESSFSSLLDEVINVIVSLLYKLKRLKSGKKLFSINGVDDNRQFSRTDTVVRYAGKDFDKMVETITKSVQEYFRKFKKSPVKEIKTNDEKVIRQYVRKSLLSGRDISDLMSAILDVIKTGSKAASGIFK